jgi:APA family basic amino acid/polyamine antiporter
VVCGAMMVSLGTATWMRLVIWTGVGVLIYAFYGYRNSRLHKPAGTAPATAR